jgi:hypothetical protein
MERRRKEDQSRPFVRNIEIYVSKKFHPFWMIAMAIVISMDSMETRVPIKTSVLRSQWSQFVALPPVDVVVVLMSALLTMLARPLAAQLPPKVSVMLDTLLDYALETRVAPKKKALMLVLADSVLCQSLKQS